MATGTEEGSVDLVELTKRIRHDIATPLAIIGQSAYYVRSKLSGQSQKDTHAVAAAGAIESEIRSAAALLKAIQPDLKLAAAVSKALELDAVVAAVRKALAALKTRVEAKPPVDAKVAKHLGILASEAERADAMLRNVEFCFKVQPVKLQPADLDPFLEKVLEGFPFPSGVKLKKGLSSKARVSLDPASMTLAVRGLLRNASEAIMPPDGSGTGGTVTVASKAEAGSAVVEVADTGPGFGPDSLAKGFTPLYAALPGKLGLGLTAVRKAMTLHKGKAELKKAAGGLVRLVLPAA
ncbi:MAG: HAMP domain-containing sensor histidine kinase [Elusimicrobiota bacterium]|jgi:signal transduction histidine kinase